MSDALADALVLSRTGERRRAARSLLRTPMLRADAAPEAHVLVRRHESWLREWLAANTGWRLVVNAEVARLMKTSPAGADPTSPARQSRSQPPFTRRRYVLTALALAALERSEAQITLGRLAEQVLMSSADPALAATGMTFTLDTREQRLDLVAVVRLLLELGVLRMVAGDEDEFVRADGDALYDIERRVLAALLVPARGPSTVSADSFEERLAALATEPLPPTEDLRTRRLRHRLTRRLLDDPVVYLDELDDAEQAYLMSQRTAITDRIAEFTGLVPEVRAEGLAMIDPDDELTDVRMPETGTQGHATLLVAEFLTTSGGQGVSMHDLTALVHRLAQEHRSYWRAGAREPGADREIALAAVERLEALRLVTVAGDTVTPRPALARYAIAPATVTTRPVTS